MLSSFAAKASFVYWNPAIKPFNKLVYHEKTEASILLKDNDEKNITDANIIGQKTWKREYFTFRKRAARVVVA